MRSVNSNLLSDKAFPVIPARQLSWVEAGNLLLVETFDTDGEPVGAPTVWLVHTKGWVTLLNSTEKVINAVDSFADCKVTHLGYNKEFAHQVWFNPLAAAAVRVGEKEESLGIVREDDSECSHLK